MSIGRLLEDKAICVCAGPGGVGKTTASAAIALGMASQGKKVAVLTIDPAWRLASSLGLDELGNEARQVEPARFAQAGIEMQGELWAMMLDAKRTFDDLIEKYAPDERTRDAVLSNRIYRELSSAVAGSQEYMAMEKLYELHQEGDYDLLVLDTPPTRHALQFLDAPERLSRFLSSRSLQVFLQPSRAGLKLFGRGTSVFFSGMRRLTGVDLLQDLSSFFQSFGDMADGFRDRARRVTDLLSAQESVFLVVSSPQPDALDEAVFFRRRLRERGMPFGGVVINRTHRSLAGDVQSAKLRQSLGSGLGDRVAKAVSDYLALAERDRANVQSLRNELSEEPLIEVPHLEDDIHDLGGLLQMNAHLFAPEAVPA